MRMREIIGLLEGLADDEGNADHLFHGTSIYNLLGIIHGTVMYGQDWDGPHGISTSQHRRVGWRFANRAEQNPANWGEHFIRPPGNPAGAVMVFSRKSLRAGRIKTRTLNIIPGESEVRILGDLEHPLRYVTVIEVRDEDIGWYEEFRRINGKDARGWLAGLPELRRIAFHS